MTLTRQQKIWGGSLIALCILVGIVVFFYVKKDVKQIPADAEMITLSQGNIMRFDGDISEWMQERPTYTLTKNTGEARDGSIWIDQTDQGLVIVGAVTGGSPQWPKNEASLTFKDHIEVWVADNQPVELPDIGWGHQFAHPTLKTEEECSSPDVGSFSLADEEQCKVWFRDQVRYRESFKKLFQRQWQISPNVQAEVYALPAFKALKATSSTMFAESEQTKVVLLQPKVDSFPTRFFETEQGYSFEMLIPWDQFPPFHALQMKDMRILVDVFSSGTKDTQGPFSSSSSKRIYGDPTTYSTFSIFNPRHYILTSCHYEVVDKLDKKYTFFMPIQTKDAYTSLFTLGNEVGGYQYAPHPAASSPSVYKNNYVMKDLGNNLIVCGPKLTYVHNNKTVRSEFPITNSVETKVLANGDVLVKQGPTIRTASLLGTGTCGACPVVDFNFYYIDLKKGTIKRASHFELRDIYESGDFDYSLSLDWNKVTIFDGITSFDDYATTTWGSDDYCFNDTTHLYEACGTQENIPEPSPRNIKMWPN